MRTHYPIYHSCTHTLEQCEYNLLNRVTAPVCQIKPRNDRMRNDRFHQPIRFRDQDRTYYEECLAENRYDDDNYVYDREHYEEEYAPRYAREPRSERRPCNNANIGRFASMSRMTEQTVSTQWHREDNLPNNRRFRPHEDQRDNRHPRQAQHYNP